MTTDKNIDFKEIAHRFRFQSGRAHDCGIRDQGEFNRLMGESIKVDVAKDLSSAFWQLVKAFQEMDYEMARNEKTGDRTITSWRPLFSVLTLLRFTSPAPLSLEVESFCEKLGISLEVEKDVVGNIASYGNIISENGVLTLIRKSKYPEWIRSRLEAWFRVHCTELKTRWLYQPPPEDLPA